MSRRARMFLGLALCATLAGLAPAAAHAGDPVIVPQPDSDGYNVTQTPACDPRAGFTQSNGVNPWRVCLLPATGDAIVDWPVRPSAGTVDPFAWPNVPETAPLRVNGLRTNRSFIIEQPGRIANWLGATNTETGYPLFWYDVGSGIPFVLPSTGYQFLLAGKYEWECAVCSGIERQRLQGTVFVIGPRVIVKPRLLSPDNSGTSISYAFDASASFVTDYTAHGIVEYAFDFQDDGTFDQISPEPLGTSQFAPGAHTIKVRVKDDTGRYGEYPLFLEVPFIRPGNPEPNPIADTGRGTLNPTGVKFSKANIKLKAVKTIRVTVLRRKGLSVKVSGMTKGDRIRAKLLKGKKTVAARATTTATSTKTVRLKVGSKGRRTLKAKPRISRLVLDVAIEGTDGFTVTKRVAVRLK